MPFWVVRRKPRAALQLQVLDVSAAFVPSFWLQAQPSRAVQRPATSQVKAASVPQRVGAGRVTLPLPAAVALRLRCGEREEGERKQMEGSDGVGEVGVGEAGNKIAARLV